MRIAFIGQKGIPAKYGGVERHVEELATRMASVGHDVFVYTRNNYTSKNKKQYKGVNLVNLPSISTKHLDAISHTFLSFLHLIFTKKVDVIHVQSIGPSLLIWIVKIFKPGTPVISTFHSQCYYHKKWNKFARWALRTGEYMTNKLPDKTIAVSRSLASYAKKKYNNRAVYIPNGVPEYKSVKAKEIKQWGLSKDSYIVAVSRLVRHKGLHYLIEAYKKLNTKKKLVIVGEETNNDIYAWELKTLAAGNKNIIFTGNQTGDTLAELYSNACLFVQPSESEGLSISLLEAMSYGRGVLVSDIPENLEAIGSTGYRFKNKDVNNLGLQLKKLLKNLRNVEAKGKQAQKRVREEYNWEDVAIKTLESYVKVINRKIKNRKSLLVIKPVRKFINYIF